MKLTVWSGLERPGAGGAAAPVLVAILLLAAAPPALAQAAGELATLEARAKEEIHRGEIFAAISTLEEAVELAPGRADLRIRLANLQKKRGMWLKAAEHYREVLTLDPAHVAARMGYAELLLADYQFAAAEEHFRVLLERGEDLEHSVFDRAQIGLGTALYGARRYQEAIEAYAVVLERHPGEPTATAYTNFALESQGNLDAAIRGWQKLLKEKPGLNRARILLAELEELKSEIVTQREKTRESPDDARAHRHLGDLLMEQPDLAGAISAYSRAAELEPDHALGRLRLGIALREAGHLKAATDVFRSLATDRELGAVASYNLAWCERRLAGPAAEAEAWRRAVDYTPTDTHAYRRYIDALSRSSHIQREVGLLLGAIKDRERDPLPRVQYGVLSMAMGRQEEAALAFLDALALEPNHPWAQRELRLILRLQPALSEKLLEEVERAEETIDSLSPVALHRKAALSLAAGQPDACVRALEPHVKSEKADGRTAVALAGCLRATGASPTKVIGLLEAARDANPNYLYARLDLALALSALGRYQEAAREAKEAALLDAGNVYALTAYGASLNELGGKVNLAKAEVALRRALQVSPMDPTGVARIIHAKVAWQLGMDREARMILKGDLPVEPEELYHIAWKFVRDNYEDRTFNGQDWSAWRDHFAGSLETEVDALGAISLMLASLDDRDTRIRAAHQTEAHMFTRRAQKVDRDVSGRATASSKTVAAETLEENVGYVAVTNMHDPELKKEVEEAFERMEKRDAVILDLRGNLGGSERDAEAISDMLVEPGTPTGSVVTPEGPVPTVSKGAEPPKIPEKPVVVLVDRNTASSAEALAGALKESKRAVIVGESTYGKAGIQKPMLLPGGTMILLATSESGDLQGISYSDRGVEPDVKVDDGRATPDPDEDEALGKARELLRRKRTERRSGPDGGRR